MAEEDLVQHERTRSVIGAFYDTHKTLGFGFLEGFYSRALSHELRQRGHEVAREFPVTVEYKGIELGRLRLDMVVDRCLVVEVKASRTLSGIAYRQLRNYLRASNLELGLILHFGPAPRVVRVYVPNLKK